MPELSPQLALPLTLLAGAMVFFFGFALKTFRADKQAYAQAQRVTGSAKNAAKGVIATDTLEMDQDVDRGFALRYENGRPVVVPNGKLSAAILT